MTGEPGWAFGMVPIIYERKKDAALQRRRWEKTVEAWSEWERCEIGCLCIRVPKRRIGWRNVLG